MNYLIENCTLIDSLDTQCKEKSNIDILIEGGYITKIGNNITTPLADYKIISGEGFCVSRGLFDMHVHLRDPGNLYKEDIVLGTQAAIAGGFTSVACMPNTYPVNDNIVTNKYILDKTKKQGCCKVYTVGAITKGSRGENLNHLNDEFCSSIVALSDDGNSVMDDFLMEGAMRVANYYNIPIISHCEDKNLSKNGVMNEGKISKFLNVPGIPRAAEENMIKRDLKLAKKTGCHLHIAHVSTKGGVELIRRAKKDGVRVTCEATPHHIFLSENLIKRDKNTSYKMNPPLRTQEDNEAIIKGLMDDTIDVIASDHAPHSMRDKRVNFKLAPFGCIGLETTLPVIIDILHGSRRLELPKIIEKMTISPMRVLNIPHSKSLVGTLADLVIFDIRHYRMVEYVNFYSKAKNCPFDRWILKGWPEYVFYKGKLVYDIFDGGIKNECNK